MKYDAAGTATLKAGLRTNSLSSLISNVGDAYNSLKSNFGAALDIVQ
jgi:hypothetical protein